MTSYIKSIEVLMIETEHVDIDAAAARIEDAGNEAIFVPRNGQPLPGLLEYLEEIGNVQAVMLPTDWWTSTVATQVATVAGWLNIPLIDEDGERWPTLSARAS